MSVPAQNNPEPKVHISLDGPSRGIYAFGLDLTKAVSGFELRWTSHEKAVLELELFLGQHGYIEGNEVDVEIDEYVQELLTRLGWTPPSEQPQVEDRKISDPPKPGVPWDFGTAE